MHAHAQEERLDSSFIPRVLGILKLDRPAYQRIAAEPGALPQGVGIVAIAAIANGIAQNRSDGLGIIGGFLAVIIGWVVVSALVAALGRLMSEAVADLPFDSTLRLLAFAQAPLALMLFTPLPGFGALINFAASMWALIAYVIAVQVVASVSVARAILILFIAAIAAGIVIFFVTALLLLPYL